MKKTTIITYLIVISILSLVLFTDMYQVLFYQDDYPFGKGDLLLLYSSKNHYLVLSFIIVVWLILAYLYKKMKKIVMQLIDPIMIFSSRVIKLSSENNYRIFHIL